MRRDASTSTLFSNFSVSKQIQIKAPSVIRLFMEKFEKRVEVDASLRIESTWNPMHHDTFGRISSQSNSGITNMI